MTSRARLPLSEAPASGPGLAGDALDALAAARFAEIARLAAQLCATPIALVSFRDERGRRLDAGFGLEAAELPWQSALSLHAARSPHGLVEVGDVAEDPRFSADPPRVGGEKIRFYAAAPLESLDEAALGALSVIDVIPRHLSERQREGLGALGRQVTTLLAMQRSVRDLVTARDAAARSSVAKSSFIASLSHELRTPMIAILGYTDLLCRRVEEPLAREHLGTIKRNGERLLGMVDDLLDLAKIEADKLAVERLRFAPASVIDEVVALMRERAESKGLGLDVRYELHLPDVVESDPLRLRQILINLLGNAIKFTASGSIEVRVGLDASRSGFAIAVADTGIGVSAARLGALFDPFEQGDASTSRHFGGTGLGLAISRRLARMLGGDITVTSEVDRGSTFTLTLATGAAPEGSLGAPDWNPGSPRATVKYAASIAPPPLAGSVLLVEDTEDVRRLMRIYLASGGMEVTQAENGALAVAEAARACESGRAFDVIFMDMQMPEMDGYEATTRLRDAGWTGPIVALTANATEGNRERCLAAGCDDYLSKPVSRSRLLDVARRLVRPTAAEAEAEAPLVSALAHDPSTAEIVEDFVRGLPRRADAVARALASGDLESASRLVHQLHGSAGTFGFPAILDAGRRLERAVQDGEATLPLVQELRALCHRARAGD